jgi:2-oxoglutarate dehydrogenase E2 component (dihydrolipoamide succinyltransferase)
MATETSIDVVMPQMGVSVSEGTIVRWVKSVGEHIEADETLLEISTDKVDTEIPSPGSGVVQEILVQEGETVAVGTRIAVIGPEGAAAPATEERPPADAAPDEDEAAEPQETPAAAAAASDAAAGSETPQPATAQPAEASGNGHDDDHTFVSPVVARIASEHGIDPATVPGTGRGGRVTKKDILAFVESGAQAATPSPAAPSAPAPSSSSL